MAITRCPYCHSLVDETSKYCQNCGTQLLFPEDEEIEEEIPGEKIIDIEEEEEPEAVEPGELETGPAAEEQKSKKEEGTSAESVPVYELEETEDESKEEGAEETEEVTLIEETERLEPGRAAEEAREPESVETTQVLEPAPAAVEQESPAAEAEAEPAAERVETGGAEAAVKLGTFDTRELENIDKTTDLGRMRLDRLFDEIMEDREERRKAEKPPDEEPEKSSGTLPPWADAMIRGGETPAAGEIAEGRPRSDSTIGLPEKVTPLSIPFETEEAEEEEAAEQEGFLPAEEAEEEEEVEKEKEAGAPCAAAAAAPIERPEAPARDITEKPFAVEKVEEGRPFSFSTFIKSRLFDILFVGVFWLVGLWLAAHSMGATIFDLLAVTARPLLVFLAILVGVYIFLFKFFLGETLGDRLFRERE